MQYWEKAQARERPSPSLCRSNAEPGLLVSSSVSVPHEELGMGPEHLPIRVVSNYKKKMVFRGKKERKNGRKEFQNVSVGRF